MSVTSQKTAGPPMSATARRRSKLTGVAVACALGIGAVIGGVPARAGSNTQTSAHIQGQGGDGIEQKNGAELTRKSDGVAVRWVMRTPSPASYLYPTPDMVPPDAPVHPPINPGEVEVFSLWMFVFNDPSACTDPCDFDDIGPTPARGGIYQLDALTAHRFRVRMSGEVWVGKHPEAGVALDDPAGAEIHVAMAPHGAAHDGDELLGQLNGPVGGPPQWWPAIFIPG